MKNNVVVFDLDGTLINPKNEIIGGTNTVQCLKALERMGCTLAICTGRLDHDILKIMEVYHLDIKHRISQNGAIIHQRHQCDIRLMDTQEGLRLYEYIRHMPVRIEVNTVSNRYWKTERDPDFPKELYDSHLLTDDFIPVIQYQPVVLFLLVGDQTYLQKIAAYVAQHLQFTKAVMTSAASLEILHVNASKGQAIQKLYKAHTIYAIGDSPNDFDMLQVADRGYLVSDTPCELPCIRMDTILDACKDIINRIESEPYENNVASFG